MDRRRLLILLALVVGILIIGGLAAFIFFGNGLETLGLAPTATPTAPPPTIAVEPGQPTPAATVAPEQEFLEVIVSQQTVPRGFLMTEAELATEFRLAADVLPNMITDIDDVVGKFARKDIYQGETLTLDALVPDLKAIGRDDYGPSSLIPPGFVAMAVPMDRLSSVAYALEPGDTIDVLVSFELLPVDEQFQTLLPNNATFTLISEVETAGAAGGEGGEAAAPAGEPETTQLLYTLIPRGRFETLPNGDIAHVAPSEQFPRGAHVAFVIQNAKVIEVGHWIAPVPSLLPTPTPDPEADDGGGDGQEEEAALGALAEQIQDATAAVTSPPYNNTLLIALPPQQQVFLKYAIESESVIDYALRGENDGELYPVENIDFNYILDRFNIEIPPNFTYVVATDAGFFDGFRSDSDILQDAANAQSDLQNQADQGADATGEGQ